MNYWEVLGIPKTDDIGIIKKAYAEKSKVYHPETHPEEFKRLHTAYKSLVSGIKSRRVVTEAFKTPDVTPAESGVKVVEVFPQKQKPEGKEVTITIDITELNKGKQPKKVVVEAYLQKEISKEKQEYRAEEDFLAQIEAIANKKSQNIYNDPMIQRLRDYLKDEKYMYAPKTWRRYFLSQDFLIRQYDPQFINAMTDILREMLHTSAKDKNRAVGRIPTYLFLYITIVYGCMFEKLGLMDTKEKVYKSELLKDLKNVLALLDSIFSDYLKLERQDELLGERFAFYVYRNILELLEYEKPDMIKLKSWLKDGFDRTNTSHVLEIMHYEPHSGVHINNVRREKNRIINSPVFYELMAFLLSSNHTNSTVLENALEEICKIYADEKDHRDEREILLLLIEENRVKRRS